MMEEVAKVISYDQGWVQVEIELKSACNHCSSDESCGTATVAKAFGTKVQRFSIRYQGQCVPGDLLTIGITESVILKAAALVYMIPLFGGAIMGGLAQIAFPYLGYQGELGVIASAVLGGVACWVLARRKVKRLEVDAEPVVLANLGQQIARQIQ